MTRPTPIAVFDILARRIVSQRVMKLGMRAAHLDANGVYLAPGEGKVFYQLSHVDLTQKHRVFTEHAVERFVPLPGGVLAVMSKGRVQIYETATMQKVNDALGVTPQFFDEYSGSGAPHREPSYRIHDGRLVIGNVVTDSESREVRFLTGRPDLPPVKDYRPEARGVDPRVAPWGLRQTPRSDSDPGTVLLARYPVAVAGVLERVSSDPPVTRVSLAFRAARSRSLLSQQVLEPAFAGRALTTDRIVLADAGEQVVAIYEKSVFLVEVPEAVREKVETGVFFALDQPTLAVDKERPVTLRFAAKGGSGELKFELLKGSSKLKLDPSTGELEIDLPRIWKEDLVVPFQREARKRAQYAVRQRMDCVSRGSGAQRRALPRSPRRRPARRSCGHVFCRCS